MARYLLDGVIELGEAESLAYLRERALRKENQHACGRPHGRPASDREKHWRAEVARIERELRALVGVRRMDELGEWAERHFRQVSESTQIHREGAEPLMRPTPALATPDAEPGTATAGTTAPVGHAVEGRPDVGAARAACTEVRDQSQRHGTARGRGEPPSQGLRPAPIEIG